jgi:SAM-dependent methyltransferase
VGHGTPVLLPVARREALSSLDDRGLLAGGWGGHPLMQRLERRAPWIAPLARALYPPAPTINTMSPAAYRRITGALVSQPSPLLLNIGSGRHTGVGRRLWRYIPESVQPVALDIAAFPGVTLVGDAGTVPLADASVDSVVIQSVLEHVRSAPDVVQEIVRVLRPGGYCYAEVPLLQGFHGDPNDFQRFTTEGLKVLFGAFEVVEIGVSVGPFSSLCWVAREIVCFPGGTGPIGLVLRYGASWILSPVRYIDWLAVRSPLASRVACELYVLARKPDTA